MAGTPDRASTQVRKHMHTQISIKRLTLIHKRKTDTHTHTHTLSSSLTARTHPPSVCSQRKKAFVLTFTDDKKKDWAERATLLLLYKATFRDTFSMFLLLGVKGSFTFMLTKNLTVRVLREKPKTTENFQETEQEPCFFLEAELFQTMTA